MILNLPVWQQLLESAEALLAQRPERPYAMFDADGTLWPLDVAYRLYAELVRTQSLKPRALSVLHAALRSAAHQPLPDDVHEAFLATFAAYETHQIAEDVAFETMITALAGLTLPELAQLHDRALGGGAPVPIRDELYAYVAPLWAQLRSMGIQIAVVSASPVWTVRYSVAQCGLTADLILGGETQLEGDTLTEHLIQPMTYYEGKLKAALAHFGVPPLLGFGDGRGDIPFLSAAALPVLIDPKPALQAAAQTFHQPFLCVSSSHLQ